MTEKNYPSATLRPKEDRRIIRGHLWAYRNEFQSLPALADGEILDIHAANRRFVGRAFYQAEGGIAARILLAHQTPVNRTFFHDRLSDAWRLRQQLFPDARVYRWVHGESDLLPGLVIDRYDGVAVVKTSCAFYERMKKPLFEAIFKFSEINSLCWAFKDEEQWEGEACKDVVLDIDGIEAGLSFGDTQKTGLFLDQRANWPLIRNHARGASVLDGYCYHGLWSCHASLGGAARVLGVDSSAAAVAQARNNAERNACAACVFEEADIQAVLARGDRYQVIVLDPPAFAKHRSQEKRAATQYEAVNVAAMNALEAGGILISCSCSHFIGAGDFVEILKRAARRAGRKAQLLEMRGAAPDHPVLLTMPETAYLKCVVLRVL